MKGHKDGQKATDRKTWTLKTLCVQREEQGKLSCPPKFASVLFCRDGMHRWRDHFCSATSSSAKGKSCSDGLNHIICFVPYAPLAAGDLPLGAGVTATPPALKPAIPGHCSHFKAIQISSAGILMNHSPAFRAVWHPCYYELHGTETPGLQFCRVGRRNCAPPFMLLSPFPSRVTQMCSVTIVLLLT